MLTFTQRILFSTILLFVIVLPTIANEPVWDASLTDWANAASNSRADILAIGDSVVLHFGDGWDAGLQHGANQTFGLAGSGIMTGKSVGEGEGIGYTNTFGSNWETDASYAFGDAALPNFGRLTAASGSATAGIIVNGTTLNAENDYVFDFWGTGGTGGGEYSIRRRLGQSPWTSSYFEDEIPFPECDHPIHRSHLIPGANDNSTQVLLNVENMSLTGMRVTEKDTTGVTVTSIGYGGRSTLDFYNDRWINRPERVRREYLQQIVQGGSGKLLIPIFEGFNDRNENQPSVNGITDADSVDAFIDNVTSLISVIQYDWLNAGFAEEDLSFLTFGMYSVAEDNEELLDYSLALQELATENAGISYLDISTLGPDFATGDQLGYYADTLHLSRDGALHYGNEIMQAIYNASGVSESSSPLQTSVPIPEPSSGLMLLVLILVAPNARRV